MNSYTDISLFHTLVLSWFYLFLFTDINDISKTCATRAPQKRLNKCDEKDIKQEANYILSNTYLHRTRCLERVKYPCINFRNFSFYF